MPIRLAAALMIAAAGAPAEPPLPPLRPAEAAARIAESSPLVVPLPVPRPEVFGPPMPRPGSERVGPPLPLSVTARLAQADQATCTRVLASGKLIAEPHAPLLGPEGCGVAAPVTLRALVLPNGRRIALEPPPILRCDLAERLADWLRDDFAMPDAQEGDLLGLADAAAFVCRSRNHVPGAKLSEHARGNAIDILAFRFATHTVGLKEAASAPFLAKVNHTACAHFSTVLGPGSDGYHEDNLHLDLEIRKNGSHYCHWQQL